MDSRGTETGADLFGAVECELNEDRLILSLNTEISESTYESLLQRLTTVATPSIKSVLIDKRGYKRPNSELDVAKSYGKRFGQILSSLNIRAALVIDPSDFYETAMCVYAMETGARIITTDSRAEATLWLDGAIA